SFRPNAKIEHLLVQLSALRPLIGTQTLNITLIERVPGISYEINRNGRLNGLSSRRYLLLCNRLCCLSDRVCSCLFKFLLLLFRRATDECKKKYTQIHESHFPYPC